MNAVPYSPEYADIWNAFVAQSKNGTFLFNRGYMDYHRDRFEDASLMAFDAASKVIAVFPASRRGSTIVSHGGLTYGGVVTGPETGTLEYLAVFKALCRRLQESGFETLEYKATPNIYHQYPADEDKYALFLLGAELCRRDLSSAILPMRRLPVRKGRRSALSKAIRSGLKVEESGRWEDFWTVLSENLRTKHGLEPVHSVAEIKLLHERFPRNIRLFTVHGGSDVVAGGVLYDTPQVTHAQYLGCGEFGRKTGALDLLLAHVLNSVCIGKAFFNFGISTTSGGWFLNYGLTDFKESFGARSVIQDCYRLDLRTANLAALDANREHA